MLSEYARLKTVMLCAPALPFSFEEFPSKGALHYERVDSQKIASEINELKALYNALGVRVLSFCPPERKIKESKLDDYFFCRDQLIRLPEGPEAAVMGVKERKDEFPLVQGFLRENGLCCESFLNKEDDVEGADILWATSQDVLIGVGARTSFTSAKKIASYLTRWSIRSHFIPIHYQVCQHLLGVLQFISPTKALVRIAYAPVELLTCLEHLGIEAIRVIESREVSERQALNIVLIDRKRLIMPSDNPKMRDFYESLGFECYEARIDECIKAAGGIACLTGIIERQSAELELRPSSHNENQGED